MGGLGSKLQEIEEFEQAQQEMDKPEEVIASLYLFIKTITKMLLIKRLKIIVVELFIKNVSYFTSRNKNYPGFLVIIYLALHFYVQL